MSMRGSPRHRAGTQIMTVPGGRDPTFPTHRHPPPLPFRDHKPPQSPQPLATGWGVADKPGDPRTCPVGS